MSRPKVEVIPVKKPKLSAQTAAPVTNRLTAAYARVSTDSDEQLISYEAQVNFYTNHIKSNPDWIFVEVYADDYADAYAIIGLTRKNCGNKRLSLLVLFLTECL
ncbi:hypothetical protein FACS189499_07330 [Clostridia bacterium]|nr:hypothetical protein FACS189499_07330 [Clostridia bacterium]